jgi:hypothetical protein
MASKIDSIGWLNSNAVLSSIFAIGVLAMALAAAWWPPPNPFEPMTEAERAKLKREIEREEKIRKAVRLAVQTVHRPNNETVH